MKITDYPQVDNVASSDKVFINQGSALKQVTKTNLFAEINTNLNELDVLGYLVPNECPIQNTIENRKLIQKVGRVDLSSLSFVYVSSVKAFYCNSFSGIKKASSDSVAVDYIYTSNYGIDTANHIYSDNNDYNMKIAINTSGWIMIKDLRYTDATTFKNSLQGQYLYYELATYNTLDIDGNEATTRLNHINNDIEYLGWSVPSECPIQNYKDADGNYHQLVGRVDLGSLDWVINDGRFSTTNAIDVKKIVSRDDVSNILCSKYTTISPINWLNKVQGIAVLGNGAGGEQKIGVYDSTYTDASAFKTAMQGVYLYYELATPITHNVGAEVVSEINNSLSTTELTTTKSIDGISKLKAFKYGKIVVVNIGINVPVLSDGTVIGNIGTSIKDKAYMTTANYNATLNVFTIETNGDIKCNGATRSANYSGATVTVITD